MAMVRCDANKHFYDSSSHAQCPYCTVVHDVNLNDLGGKTELAGGFTASSQIGTQRVYDNDPTVALDQGKTEPTVALNSSSFDAASSESGSKAEPSPTPAPAGRGALKTKILSFGTAVESSGDLGNMGTSMRFNKLPVTGWLVVVDGPGLGLDFRLIQGENRIGRDSDMEVCLDLGLDSDDMVSRDSHAIVVYDNHANVFFVERGRSRNMPLLNGRTIRSGEDIKSGDIIQVGKTKLMLISFCNEGFQWG